ncbi:MAG: adenylyl-sulfate kinase [Azonexus sp.]
MTKISDNLVWHQGQVCRTERELLLGQRGVTLWLTGLSAAGKSTLAFALERMLLNSGRVCYVLDGDNVRHGLNKGLTFSVEDRSENIRRIAEVARLMNDAGLIVISAFISPFRADRSMAREIIGQDHFREIYINTTLAVCESRDPKGLYNLARVGQIADFTGISSPYEPPENPDLVIDTEHSSQDQACAQLIKLIQPIR